MRESPVNDLPVATTLPPASTAGATPWGLTFVWLGDHWARDWARMLHGSTQFDSPMSMASEEGEAASSLMRDWWVAMGAMWSYPMSIWLSSMSQPTKAPTRAGKA
jgi:hypothetical protein